MCYSQEKSKPYLVKDPDCDNGKPWADEVENAVVDMMFKRAHIVDWQDTTAVEADPIKMLESQKAMLVNKLKRLYNIYAEGDDTITQVISETKDEMSRVEKRIEGETVKRATTLLEADIREKLGSIEETWQYLDISERQNIIRSMINKIIITGEHIHIDFKY
jgi:site-specific DNA recombinase